MIPVPKKTETKEKKKKNNTNTKSSNDITSTSFLPRITMQARSPVQITRSFPGKEHVGLLAKRKEEYPY